jgi:hypothetical protein
MGSIYWFVPFYFVKYFSQVVTNYFLNTSMEVFSKEWLREERLKEQSANENPIFYKVLNNSLILSGE